MQYILFFHLHQFGYTLVVQIMVFAPSISTKIKNSKKYKNIRSDIHGVASFYLFKKIPVPRREKLRLWRAHHGARAMQSQTNTCSGSPS